MNTEETRKKGIKVRILTGVSALLLLIPIASIVPKVASPVHPTGGCTVMSKETGVSPADAGKIVASLGLKNVQGNVSMTNTRVAAGPFCI